MWFFQGKLHREGAPAIERVNGDRMWYFQGKLQEEAPKFEWVNCDREFKPTSFECIISYEIPIDKYLQCSLKEDHVYDYNQITTFKRGIPISQITCLYCQSPLKPIIYENRDPESISN
jgi:hypothetical protein